MIEKTKEPETFLLLNNDGGTYILKLDPKTGVDAAPASINDTLRAMRIGVACLNTGKSDKEIFQAIEALTP